MLRKHIIAALEKMEMNPMPGRVVDHLEAEVQAEVGEVIKRLVTPGHVARAFALSFGAPVPRAGQASAPSNLAKP